MLDNGPWSAPNFTVCNECGEKTLINTVHNCTKNSVLEKVSVMSLQPDDILVLKSKFKFSEINEQNIKRLLETNFPGHKAICLEEGFELSVVRPSLKWTKDLPTKEGWYWHRYYFDELMFMEPLRVIVDEEPFYCERPGVYDYTDLIEFEGDEWYGPIEPPEYS